MPHFIDRAASHQAYRGRGDQASAYLVILRLGFRQLMLGLGLWLRGPRICRISVR
jgi:hypothetical protein